MGLNAIPIKCENNWEGQSPPRILMLVPHEPERDPRIKWVTNLCAQIGRTDILGFTLSDEKPAREYDGIIYTERVKVDLFSSRFKMGFYQFLRVMQFGSRRLRRIVRFLEGWIRHRGVFLKWKVDMSPPPSSAQEPFKSGSDQRLLFRNLSMCMGKAVATIVRRIISVPRFLLLFSFYYFTMDALYRHARAVSIIPRLVICHDIYALAAGVRMKKLHGCPVIYDSHELWPEADLEAENWEKKVTAFIERRLIRYADVVITVTPQIARHLEGLYGITGVLSVPNAEPFHNTITPSYERPISLPLNFLYQGGVAPGRGIEEFIELWSQVEKDRAILILRAPENDYYAYLQTKFNKEISTGRIVISSPVTENELVRVACSADVGVIPYGGPNLNHIYACPNKLSQYMRAGLAILCNADMEFVSSMIGRYECGLTYNADRPGDLITTVQSLVNHPQKLQSMKENAYKAARTEFNWKVQSVDYSQAIGHLYHRGD